MENGAGGKWDRTTNKQTDRNATGLKTSLLLKIHFHAVVHWMCYYDFQFTLRPNEWTPTGHDTETPVLFSVSCVFILSSIMSGSLCCSVTQLVRDSDRTNMLCLTHKGVHTYMHGSTQHTVKKTHSSRCNWNKYFLKEDAETPPQIPMWDDTFSSPRRQEVSNMWNAQLCNLILNCAAKNWTFCSY